MEKQDVLRRMLKLNEKQFDRVIKIIETVLDAIEEEVSEKNDDIKKIYKGDTN